MITAPKLLPAPITPESEEPGHDFNWVIPEKTGAVLREGCRQQGPGVEG